MARAGVARATRFYRQSLVIDRYRELYRSLMRVNARAAVA
jgi:hypothetical protein